MPHVDLSRVDIRLAVTDSPVASQPVKIRCREPQHRDSEMSMAVYRDGIKCFGCGMSVPRTMEALAYLLFGDAGRWRAALRVAENYIGPTETHRGRVEPVAKPLPVSRAELFAAHLWGPRRSRVEWLCGRGLTHETIRMARLGHTGTHFTIPVFDRTNQLVTMRFRRDDVYTPEREGERPASKYTGMDGRNGLYLYPEWLIAEHHPTTLYVWEGEFDTLLSWQLGLQAVTITNGADNLKKLPGLIRERFPFVQRLIIGGDMDKPGRNASLECYRAANTLHIEVSLVRWGMSKGKDLTELVANGFTLPTNKQPE